MARFGDLEQYFEDTLTLPVDGRGYVIPSPDAELGLWAQMLMAAGVAIQAGETPAPLPPLPPRPGVPGDRVIRAVGNVVDDASEHALYERLLGPVWRRLLDDGVSWPKIQIVAQTALMWVGGGLEMAEAFWVSGGDPNAVAPPNRAARRAASTPGTGGANTTRSPNSTSGTRSPRTGGGRSRRRR